MKHTVFELPADIEPVVKRARQEFQFIKLLIIGGIWACLTLMAAPILLYSWPDIEARIWPVLTDQKIEHVRVTEDGKFEKFEWTYTKSRRATIDFAAFMAFKDYAEKYTADVFVGDDCKDSFRTSRTSPKGDTVTKTLCVRIPPPLVGRGPIQIRGLIEWNVGHGFYTVPDLIPPITAWDAS